jgi:GDP-L-fucose synthase
MKKWLVAGSSGMAGRSIVRALEARGDSRIYEVSTNVCDFRDSIKTFELFQEIRPDIVVDAAAKVGGIVANSDKPVDFLLENMQIQNNLMSASHEVGVEKFVFLSSSCVYPKFATQPIKENSLMTGVLEETNSAYAVAKISGMRLIEAYREQFGYSWISVMPTNLFGPFDNFSTETSHVLPALIRKFHEAKINKQSSVVLWGTGKPLREFMHVTDFSNALLMVTEKYNDNETINIGTGEDITILDLAHKIKEVVGFTGDLIWDITKPDGTPKKQLDVSKLKKLGFSEQISLDIGLEETYSWFLKALEDKSIQLKL